MSRASRALRCCEKFENLENGTAISVAVCASRFSFHTRIRTYCTMKLNGITCVARRFPLFGRISPVARCPVTSRRISLPLPTLPYSAHCGFNIVLRRYFMKCPVSQNYFREIMQYHIIWILHSDVSCTVFFYSSYLFVHRQIIELTERHKAWDITYYIVKIVRALKVV